MIETAVRGEAQDIKDRLGEIHKSIGRLSSSAGASESGGARLRLRIDCEAIAESATQGGATTMVVTPQETQTVVPGVTAAPITSNQTLASVTAGLGKEIVGIAGIPSAQDVLNSIAFKCFQTVDTSKPEELNGYVEYLERVRKVLVVGTHSGSLIIIVECSSLQILEELWKDYCTGHLNEMAQKFLVTKDILKEFGLTEMKLTTTIAEEEYRDCQEYFLKHPGVKLGIASTAGQKEQTADWEDSKRGQPGDQDSPPWTSEIMKAARENNPNLGFMSCFEHALLEASRCGHMDAICALISTGEIYSFQIKHCVSEALKFNFYEAAAMLLICYAAKHAKKLLLKYLMSVKMSRQEEDQALAELAHHGVQRNVMDRIRRFIADKETFNIAVPIGLALQQRKKDAVEIILMNTNCNQQQKRIDWPKLVLSEIDPPWLENIKWVEKLFLASNLLTSVPSNIHILDKLCVLDLRKNQLKSIPARLLQMPNLRDLRLSENKIAELPKKCKWSPSLKSLCLNDNLLETFPKSMAMAKLTILGLARNNLYEVPACICQITTLHSLDLSGNPRLTKLPYEMGKLRNIGMLRLENLDQMTDPPEEIKQNSVKTIMYLRNGLRSSKACFTLKLMLAGRAKQGKTTLMHRLMKDYSYNINISTNGIAMDEFHYKRKGFGLFSEYPKYTFQIWDFGGQEEFFTTHQCLLSTLALYLLVWNLEEGENGIEMLKSWLDAISTTASKTSLIIVGTHLDKVRKDKEAGYPERMLQVVKKLVVKYAGQINVLDIKEVSCALRNREGIDDLRVTIYDAATALTKSGLGHEVSVMGEMIPHSFWLVADAIRAKRLELQGFGRMPIMHKLEYEALVLDVIKNDTFDIEDTNDLREVTQFMHERGILLHYDDPNQDLQELYFIDPKWLCELMARIVTSRVQPYINNGVLSLDNLPFLFEGDLFSRHYSPQFIRLLNRFQIACSLDDKLVLLPSKLLPQKPEGATTDVLPFITLKRIHSMPCIPHGFWSRLISRFLFYMKDMLSGGENFTRDEYSSPFQLDSCCCSCPLVLKNLRSVGRVESDPDRFAVVVRDPDGSATGDTSSGSPRIGTPHLPCCPFFKDVPIENLPQLPTDVATLFDDGFLLCWKSGVCLRHPRLFLLLHCVPDTDDDRQLVITEVSPCLQGRRVLSCVVDHIDTLIEEWYQELSVLDMYGQPWVRQFIPCVVCERLGLEPYKFTFAECQMQSSKSDTIACPKHPQLQLNLHQVAPDIMLHDVDADLLLSHDEITYEDTDSNKLGSGGFGKVVRGRCRGQAVAIKFYIQSDESEPLRHYREARKELNVLRRVRQHPFLISVIGVSLRPLCLVLELAECGTLFDIILKQKSVDRIVLFRIAYQVADALRFLHDLGVIYRDLKPENVLVWSLDERDDLHVKLINFGTANFSTSTGLISFVGIPGMIAPEMLECANKEEYTAQVDVYSYAILLYQLMTRLVPFEEYRLVSEINAAVIAGERPKWQHVQVTMFGLPTLTELMLRCWSARPTRRPTTAEIVQQVRQPAFQCLLAKQPIPAQQQSVRHACLVPDSHDLWLACDGHTGNKIFIYDSRSLNMKFSFSIDTYQEQRYSFQIQCMHFMVPHVLIALRGGLDLINAYSTSSASHYKCVASMSFDEQVTCVTSNDEYIFAGFNDGNVRCILKTEMKSEEYRSFYSLTVGHHQINSVTVAQDKLWVSTSRYIFRYFTKSGEMEAFDIDAMWYGGPAGMENNPQTQISFMKVAFDEQSVLSVCRSVLSKWDVNSTKHHFSVDCGPIVHSLTATSTETLLTQSSDADACITCVESTRDAIWVGTASGQILIFDSLTGHLLTWFHPFDETRSLTLMYGPGSCGTEQNYVISTGKGLRPEGLGGRGVCVLSAERVREPSIEISPRKVSERSLTPTCDEPDTVDANPTLPSRCTMIMWESVSMSCFSRMEAKSGRQRFPMSGNNQNADRDNPAKKSDEEDLKT